MAARRPFARNELVLGRPCDHPETRHRRRRGHCSLCHSRQRTISVARQSLPGRRRTARREEFPTFSVGLPRLNSDRKSTRLNSSHQIISYAVFCLKKKKKK